MKKDFRKAKLVLEDGSEFQGYSFAFPKNTNGEVVFNTGMVGYPETMTDPSYRGQILVCTYPLIGNYGVPNDSKENGLYKNFESNEIHVRALVISDYSNEYSHWSAVQSLGEWMCKNKIPGIFGIDTRKLTQKLRDKGTMLGKIIINENEKIDFEELYDNEAIAVTTDEDGTVWFSSDKSGVIRYDGKGITVFNLKAGLTTNAMVYRGLTVSDGLVWLCTKEGAFTLNPQHYSWKKTKTPNSRAKAGKIKPRINCRS